MMFYVCKEEKLKHLLRIQSFVSISWGAFFFILMNLHATLRMRHRLCVERDKAITKIHWKLEIATRRNEKEKKKKKENRQVQQNICISGFNFIATTIFVSLICVIFIWYPNEGRIKNIENPSPNSLHRYQLQLKYTKSNWIAQMPVIHGDFIAFFFFSSFVRLLLCRYRNIK